MLITRFRLINLIPFFPKSISINIIIKFFSSHCKFNNFRWNGSPLCTTCQEVRLDTESGANTEDMTALEIRRELKAIKEQQRRMRRNYEAESQKIDNRIMLLEELAQENNLGKVEVSDAYKFLKAASYNGKPVSPKMQELLGVKIPKKKV